MFTHINTDDRIEIIVVPNGCTDNTAEVASSQLRKLIEQFKKAIILTPIALMAFLVDLLVFIPANYKLSKGVGMNYW